MGHSFQESPAYFLPSWPPRQVRAVPLTERYDIVVQNSIAAALDSLELLRHEASDNLAHHLVRIHTAREELGMTVEYQVIALGPGQGKVVSTMGFEYVFTITIHLLMGQ